MIIWLTFTLSTALYAQEYYPPYGSWARRSPAELGLDPAAIDSAVAFAQAHESSAPRNQETGQSYRFGREPFGEGVGPFKTRGPATGLIIHRGYLVAAWGEPERVDMTHSVSKTFLSSVVGIAVDQGLIRNVQDTVADYVQTVEPYHPQVAVNRPAEAYEQPYLLQPFVSEHNRRITWEHLLRQTSDWEGTLWGKPDWADRPAEDLAAERSRARHAPGSVWEYNDTRVNVLALAATMVWRRPLPEVLHEYLMQPIGASPTWHWAGYRNSWIVLNGQAVQSVSGGGHWGGGMFLHAYDQARLGLLCLRDGRWEDQQILSEAWIAQARTSTPARPTYGYMNWFLNPEQELLPSAPTSAVAFLGNGTNMIYVDQTHDLVVVARWIDNNALNGLINAVLKAW
jgi:CubicO group peptidase (beta-lactamase class C family)